MRRPLACFCSDVDIGPTLKLKVWLGKIKALDFDGAPLASEADAWLARCEEVLDA